MTLCDMRKWTSNYSPEELESNFCRTASVQTLCMKMFFNYVAWYFHLILSSWKTLFVSKKINCSKRSCFQCLEIYWLIKVVEVNSFTQAPNGIFGWPFKLDSWYKFEAKNRTDKIVVHEDNCKRGENLVPYKAITGTYSPLHILQII